eukprot:TRINITY_DN7674_c0_g1_i1.p1 TRINITY_DN7674_c0_g1~~TRINITY_DN7674_c0_g1_i1.p1  ORF type:complete len:685 (-),score=339.68 TRINITY_DN7674_c0_g1_i1:333-2387(-)
MEGRNQREGRNMNDRNQRDYKREEERDKERRRERREIEEKEEDNDREKRREREKKEEDGGSKENDYEISLSIEETNKLRAQLGMKPLNVADKKKEREEKEKEWEEKRKEQKIIDLQSRTERMRKKREESKKWSGKSIAEEYEEEESTASWIERSKKQQSQLAAQFDELDDQSSQKSKKKNENVSTSGLVVDHSLQAFNDIAEGVILTLKDEYVLKDGKLNDNDETHLENVRISEQEKREKNQKLLKKKPVYNVFEEKKTMLSQYDDEETKNPQPTFKIGEGGVFQQDASKSVREKLLEESSSIYDLEVSKNQIASDYLTTEEMSKTSFKKKKKGERKKGNTRKKVIEPIQEEDNKNDVVMEESNNQSNSKEDEIVDEDEVLVRELSRKKALLSQKENTMEIDEEELIKSRAASRQLEEAQNKSSIVFSSTSEFVKTIQSEPERKEAEIDEREELQKSLQSSLKRRKMQEEEKLREEEKRKEEEENGEMDEDKNEEDPNEPEKILEEEPLVSEGLSSTLALLKSRGELDPLGNQQYVGRRNDPKLDHAAKLDALNNRKGEIQLIHRDDSGRRLTVKEAFRHLSWNFHGMKPSKNTMEKRMRQMEEDQKRASMSMSDTPLQSATAMKNEQERSQNPFIVLSKGNMSTTSLPTALESSREKSLRGDKNFNVAPLLHKPKDAPKKRKH